VSRALVWTLYAALVLVWSSTWVVIALGLEDVAPFFGAGLRFTLAGVGVLGALPPSDARCAPTRRWRG
jgi:drug/metabolite transporter (DMT)-like permease